MKFLCLVYQEEKEEANVPRDTIEQAKKEYWAFAESIKQSGNYLVSHGLQHTDQQSPQHRDQHRPSPQTGVCVQTGHRQRPV